MCLCLFVVCHVVCVILSVFCVVVWLCVLAGVVCLFGRLFVCFFLSLVVVGSVVRCVVCLFLCLRVLCLLFSIVG